MKNNHTKQIRVLAIAPSTRGFGFAVMDGEEILADWGIKSVEGEKNAESIKKLEKMIAHYQPEVLVLEDYSAIGSRRSVRIRELGQQITSLASNHKIRKVIFTRNRVRKFFFIDGRGTKQALAEMLAKRFPEELGFRLPPKRKPWMSEDYQMGVFDAVALALVFASKKKAN